MQRRASVADRWAAAVFDGYGRIYARRIRGNNHTLHVGISVRTDAIADLMEERFGGSVAGKGTPGASVRWMIHGSEARSFLKAIRRHTTRPQRIELATEFLDTLGSPGKPVPDEVKARRGAIAQELKGIG